MRGICNYVLLGEAGCGKSELAINLSCGCWTRESPWTYSIWT